MRFTITVRRVVVPLLLLTVSVASQAAALDKDPVQEDPWYIWCQKLKKDMLSTILLPESKPDTVGFYSLTGRFWFDKEGIIHDLKFEITPKTANIQKCAVYTSLFKTALLKCQPLRQMHPKIIRKKSCANFAFVPFPEKTINPDPIFRVNRESCWKGDI